MQIHKMSATECCDLLARLSSGRLACARDNQPYVVPIHFAYELNHIYGFATVGLKVEWMRSNPLVCVEADEVKSPDEWMSLIAMGRYEELSDPTSEPRLRAYSLLKKKIRWWQAGFAAAQTRGQDGQTSPLFYRIHINEISGHRATP